MSIDPQKSEKNTRAAEDRGKNSISGQQGMPVKTERWSCDLRQRQLPS